MPRLILINAPDRPSYEVRGEEFVIGRLPDCDLVLADALVSRKHAVIKESPQGFSITDLDSMNGVYINNLKISGEERLAHGDLVVIGESRLLFSDSPDKESPALDPFSSTPSGRGSGIEPTPAAGVRVQAPGLGGPEIIKPLSESKPYDMEIISLDKGLKSGEISAPNRAEPNRSRNFFILYQVARALNSTNSLAELLDQTMTLVFQVINAERGVIFLYGQKGELEPMISRNRSGGELPEMNVSRTVTQRAIYEQAGIITADARYDPRFREGASIVAYNIRSAICVPLWERGRIKGAVYLDNLAETYAFGEDDLDLLTAIANQVAVAIEHEQMQKRMRENAITRANLERFHSPDVAGYIMQQARLENGLSTGFEEREVTILFCDICDFTSMLERLKPSEAARLLVDFFDRMTEIIFRYKGTVDKFIGDAVMAIFGAPISHGNDAEMAVTSAVEMIKQMESFKATRPENERFDIRIGINTGMVVAGYLGSTKRIEYTVLGDEVNVAARLTDLAAPGAILAGKNTMEYAKQKFEFKSRGETRLKGKREQTPFYEVVF